MSRFARNRRVFYWEEPFFDSPTSRFEVATCPRTHVTVVTPHLPAALASQDHNATVRTLLQGFLREYGVFNPVAWFYTPMALDVFPENLRPRVTVYDCMDELSMFRGAPAALVEREAQLLKIADVVFTGGVSLFEAKHRMHKDVRACPSGVDVDHFAQARRTQNPMVEQDSIPRPRLGYAGVIDERLDLPLIDEVARKRPDWQIVMIGPTAKIDPASLPSRPNIHWLGKKEYTDLPKYFAGWDVALMPFALNDATRFISPTKTPEYLCAGLPVVSTPIRDVVRPYGELGLVRIAETPDQFISCVEQALTGGMCLKWRERADEFLKSLSWDSVWAGMNEAITRKEPARSIAMGAGNEGECRV